MRERLKEILDQYCDVLRGDMKRRGSRSRPWILQGHVNHDIYVRALEVLLDEARQEGRLEGSSSLAEQLDYQCACRCRKHGHRGCPRCLNVYGCPVHTEADPSVLRPEFLEDPRQVAAAIWSEAVFLGTPLPSGVQDDADAWRAFVEAVRRVVTSRLESRK